jgi:hypothetical protein
VNKVPQTVGEEVVAGINALLAESDRLRDRNAPEIQTLLFKAAQLQKVDARKAFINFGFISAICGDLEGLEENFRRALNLPDQPETKHEFWVCTGDAGLYGKAHEIGAWLLEPRKHFFPSIWERAAAMGQILGVWTRHAEAKRLFQEQLANADFSRVERAAKVMQERGLADEDIARIFDLMGEIQREHKIMYAGFMVSSYKVIMPPDEPPYLHFAISVDVPATELHAMNRKLATAVVNKAPGGAFPQGMVGTFAKSQPAALRAAA